MIKKTTRTLAVLLIGISLAGLSAHADDKPEPVNEPAKTEEDLQKQITEALNNSGLDPKMVEQITQSLGGNESSSVSIHTTVIGPDGKVTSSQETGTEIIDLNTLISTATKMAEEASKTVSTDDNDKNTTTSVNTSVSGKVIVMGPDGKTQTHTLGEGNQNAPFQKALSEALTNIDLKALEAGNIQGATQVFGFGPAVVQSEDLEKRLASMEQELQEQKKLLKQILSKLK